MCYVRFVAWLPRYLVVLSMKPRANLSLSRNILGASPILFVHEALLSGRGYYILKTEDAMAVQLLSRTNSVSLIVNDDDPHQRNEIGQLNWTLLRGNW